MMPESLIDGVPTLGEPTYFQRESYHQSLLTVPFFPA